MLPQIRYHKCYTGYNQLLETYINVLDFMTICSPMTGSQIVQFLLFEVIKKSNTKIYLLSRRDEEKFSTRLANLRKLIFAKVFRFKTHSI